jgi:carboxyl-terminal processing protease
LGPNRGALIGICLPLAFVWGWLLVPAANASIDPERLKALRGQAEIFESQNEWDKACGIYESILRLERGLKQVKERYHHCLRRYWQARRHQDVSYRKEVLGLEYGQALRLYNVLLETLLDNALDRKKVDAGRLFRKGLEELSAALSEPAFVQNHLSGAKLDDIRAFKDHLWKNWGNVTVSNRPQALKKVREVALAASAYLNLNSTITVMEFTCGAGYAVDEYTMYLTPSQLCQLCDSLKGEFVGVGIRPITQDKRLIIGEVTPNSSAAEEMLMPGDVIVSIDRKPAAGLTADTAWEALLGPAGTTVDLLIQTGMTEQRTLSLRRRAQLLPSVAYRMESDLVGYLQIVSFQETTVQELDVALLSLSKAGMKALILDLRGNPGGLFEVAVDVARRFLPSGVIATTQNQDARFNTIYESRNPDAYLLPLVVLVDGDTASAAEVLAGALKENRRARLVGQTTFGKGCVQNLLKLPPAPGGVPTGGLRITVARFFSPAGSPYTGRGVMPHLFAERNLMPPGMGEMDHQLDEARMEAHRLMDMPR